MSASEVQPPYTLYYANRCDKCQRFLQHIQGVTMGKYLIYFDVQQQRAPREVQFVPTLVDNHTQRQYVGRQAFEMLQLWLKEKTMQTAPTLGRKGLSFGDYESETAVSSNLFGVDY